jgi:hypothetical protein
LRRSLTAASQARQADKGNNKTGLAFVYAAIALTSNLRIVVID